MESVGGRKRFGHEGYVAVKGSLWLTSHPFIFFFLKTSAQITHKKPLHPLFLSFPVGLVWFREVST